MKKFRFFIAIFLLALISFLLSNSIIKYNKFKNVDVDFTDLSYRLYVTNYYSFPISDEHFKQYFISVALNMDKTTSFIKNNPIIDNSVQFTQYKDADSLSRIRATLSKKSRSVNELIKNAVSLEDYNFIHFLTNSKSILLFDYPAMKCNGRRHLMIFQGSEPDRCFDEKEINITRILKGFYKGKDELFDLAYGSQRSCYHIRAKRSDSAFVFGVECMPQDSAWIDQKGVDMLLDTLIKSFNTTELMYVDRFYFPLIAKNSTLQQYKNIKSQVSE